MTELDPVIRILIEVAVVSYGLGFGIAFVLFKLGIFDR